MTTRQRKLLQAIINEFIETAEAVGSEHLAKKYGIDLSPATIRNEMSDLVKMGYLAKPHSSSGRVPTIMGYKEMLEDIRDQFEDIDVALESVIREELFQSRFNIEDFIYRAIGDLTRETKNVSFAIVNHHSYYAGLSNVINYPEFADSVLLGRLLQAIEDHTVLLELLNKFNNNQDVRVLFGEDTGIDYFVGTSLIYKLVQIPGDKQGFLGIIGPVRMNYPKNIAMVDFIGKSINDMLHSW